MEERDGSFGATADATPRERDSSESVRPASGRTVLHVDIDAFFASVEQIRYPRLKGKPVVVGAGVIASCSYEARKFGLTAGMRLTEARRRCPQVIILDGHEKVYRSFAARIFDLCGTLGPSVETYLDEAYCDLTGTERHHRGDLVLAARRFRERIRREIGLSVTVGLGSSRMVAKMASKAVKPDGLHRVPHGEEDAFIRSLPVAKLPGVGHATAQVLERLNVRTIEDLRLLSPEHLERLFGAPGRLLYERCRGRDTRPVSVREIPASISRETSFHADTIDPEEIAGMLYYLTERAVRTARGLHLKARTVTTRIRYSDSGGDAASRSLARPSDRDQEIYDVAMSLLARLHTRRESLHGVGVVLSSFVPDAAGQLDLFDGGRGPRLDRLYESLDRVRGRFGHSAVVAGRSVKLLGRLQQDGYGFVLRTPSLTK
jgi:DNA polymerase IV